MDRRLFLSGLAVIPGFKWLANADNPKRLPVAEFNDANCISNEIELLKHAKTFKDTRFHWENTIKIWVNECDKVLVHNSKLVWGECTLHVDIVKAYDGRQGFHSFIILPNENSVVQKLNLNCKRVWT